MKSNSTGARRATLSVGMMALFVVALGFAVGGCETMSHEQQGEVIGGVLGGVLGSQVGDGSGKTAAIIVGTIAGAMIGRHVGQSMDDTDRMKAAAALRDSRTDERTTWINPDTGNRYVLTPTRTYKETSGPCREFTLDANVGQQADQEIHGTACLQADGSWLVS